LVLARTFPISLLSTPAVNAMYFALNLLQIAFSQMGIIVSIGLLQLREAARKAANSRTGREGIAAGYGAMLYGTFLLLLLPLSIWWCVALRRVRVKSQFPEK
jgi:hypothetical protein